MSVIGCVFAGGKGRRLGGRDKSKLVLAEVPLWKHVTDRLSPMVDRLIVTGATAPDWIGEVSGCTFVPDVELADEPIGPAGGLFAGLEWGLAQTGSNARLLTVPVDAPFFPKDLYEKLATGLGTAPAALAETDARLQPAFGLWSCAVAPNVRKSVESQDFALHVIARRIGATSVRLEVEENAFLNINTPEDLKDAEWWFGGDLSVKISKLKQKSK